MDTTPPKTMLVETDFLIEIAKQLRVGMVPKVGYTEVENNMLREAYEIRGEQISRIYREIANVVGYDVIDNKLGKFK